MDKSSVLNTLIIRQKFLDYFRKNQHKYMPQSKIYNEDPSLLFVNAGMNQLKDIILGKKVQERNYDKLMNFQVCVRAGGKHNDLDDVGKDSYHLTSFVMLGNWNLNCKSKLESITYAYDFLTKVCNLDPSRMYVTYFEGSESTVGRGFVLRKIFRRMMMNFYLHLNRCKVIQIMNKPIIKCLISDILAHYLWNEHDADMIQKALMEEEILYIGKLYNIRVKFAKNMKKSKDIDKVYEKLRCNEGIDKEYIMRIDDLIIAFDSHNSPK